MFAQMDFQEMMKRAEEGTLLDVLNKDYSVLLGHRFKMYDVLEDIEIGINQMKEEKKLNNIKSVTLSELNDDVIFLGIKFKNDRSKGKYSILVECSELIKRYKITDKRKKVKKEDEPGLFGGMKELKRGANLVDSLINLIIENE